MIQSIAGTSIESSKANLDSKINNHNKKIAFIEPTFTYAAYRNGSFYNFYDKYSPKIQFSSNLSVVSDLNLLKNIPIPHKPFFYFIDPTYTTIPYKDYFDLLLQHVRNYDKDITNLTDVDAHLGKIFQNDGRNAYDVLFLFHNEYVTQSEYDNLKQFVYNGGTIIFTEANTLFAEVSYNNNSDSITLVNGHYWKFDGKTAKNSTGERWLKENKEWMGSNYLDVTDKVNFRNNPFNYTHVEEQYVNSPLAKVLLDYKAYDLPSKYSNATVATYEMNYGKGKIIDLGIWGHTLINNTAFINYLDNVIIPLALNQTVVSNLNIKDQNNNSNIAIISSNLSKTILNYPFPPTLNNIEGSFNSVCEPPSGSFFSIGDTPVKCVTTTEKGNNKIIIKFVIRVLNENITK